MDGEGRVIEDGAVAVDGSTIEAVGDSADFVSGVTHGTAAPRPAPGYEGYQLVAAEGRVAVPGLINSHTHFSDILFRGLVEGLPLESWLEKLWVAERGIVGADTVYAASRLAAAEMLLAGTTTAVNMFWYPDRTVEAATGAGMRLVTGPLFFDGDNPEERDTEEQMEFAEKFLSDHAGNRLLYPAVMPHGTYTVRPDTMARLRPLLSEERLLFHIHASETETEVKTVRDEYGRTPVELLESLGLLEGRSLLAHGVHLTDRDLEILAGRPSALSYNPVSNLKLGSGIARVPEVRKRGIPIGLATDGPVSSNDLDLWTALRCGVLIQNGISGEPTTVTPYEGFAWVTREGARALGRETEIGSLEAGKRADITLLATEKPHLLPRFDIYAWLVYTAGRDDVTDVFIDGDRVVREGVLTTMDTDEAMREIRALQRRIESLYESPDA
jgi:5-methylthioadenosine/S-adenosylhomocysteine deaminase